MSETDAARGPRVLFQVGWWVLVVLTALFALNHLVGVWAFSSSDDEQMMFLVFAALQVLSLVVLLIPYRRVEWWAWWATWIPVLAVGATALVSVPLTGIGMLYLGVAAILALAQIATLARFRGSR